MTEKLTVPYEWNPVTTSPTWLALTKGARPSEADWLPAFRDTVDGVRVVWTRVTPAGPKMVLWLKDYAGIHRLDTRTF